MTERHDAPIRGQMRVSGYRRVTHGVFLTHHPELSAWAEWCRDLMAWLLVLPPGAVFTGLTAARLLGWDQIGRASCRERVCQYV